MAGLDRSRFDKLSVTALQFSLTALQLSLTTLQLSLTTLQLSLMTLQLSVTTLQCGRPGSETKEPRSSERGSSFVAVALRQAQGDVAVSTRREWFVAGLDRSRFDKLSVTSSLVVVVR